MTKRPPENVVQLAERQKRIQQQSQELVSIHDLISNAPSVDAVIPAPYSLDDDHTFRLTVGEDGEPTRRIIAHSPILIVGILRDVESDREAWELCWKRHKSWQYQTVDRETCADSRKIVSLSAFGFAINSTNARALVQYLSELEAANMNRLPVSYVSSHLGWHGQNGESGFLFGRQWISESNSPSVSFRGADIGDEQLADGYHQAGDIDTWIKALGPAMKHPRARVAFYTAFVPALLEIIKCSNFIVDFAGRTSVGKTTLQRIAASVVGNPDERMPNSALGTWDSTKVFLERASAVVTGLPVVLDDTKRAKNGKTVADMLYTVANGRGRGRGNVKGISRTGTWRTVLISSGEQPAISFTNDGGTRGRVLEIRGMPFDQNDSVTRRMVERLNIDLMTNYGHGMPLFVQWLIKNRDEWPQWTQQYRDAIAKYADGISDPVAGRLGAYAAAIEVTAALVHVAFATEEHPLPWQVVNPIDGLWEGIVREAGDPLGEEEALRDVMAWATANEKAFFGRHDLDIEGRSKVPTGGWYGRWNRGPKWPYIAFSSPALKQLFTKQGYNDTEVLNAWRERGWIDVPSNQKGYQKMVRLDGERQWFIVLKREAVEGLEQ